MTNSRIPAGTAPAAEMCAAYWHASYVMVLMVGAASLAFFHGGVYAVLILGALGALLAYVYPRTGLWLSLALVMVASLIAPPAGFEFGAGDSPELPYWAVATSCLLLAMALRYTQTGKDKRVDGLALGQREVTPPTAFFAYAALAIFSALLGAARGYPLLNVAKQFYGCVLFCAYFLFALKFAPQEEGIASVLDWLNKAGLLCALVYITIYMAQIPEKGMRKTLTMLSAYAGGLAVLHLPKLLPEKNNVRRISVAMAALALFAVPLLAQYKRGILAVVVCVFLCIGLRARSRRRRYLWSVVACLLFTAAIATNAINPVSQYFSRYESLKYLFPEDIQSSYSVYLRTQEFTQVLDSMGGVPLLGTGLGSTLEWYDPYSRMWWEQETMASGWGYLLVKTGVLGTTVFLWLVLGLMRSALRTPLRGLRLGVFLLLVFQFLQMVADPFFLNFLTSAWAGMTCGFVHVLNRSSAGASDRFAARSLPVVSVP